MKHKSSFDLAFPGLLRRQENPGSSEFCGCKPEIKISYTMKTGVSAFGCCNQVAAGDSAPTDKTLKPAAPWPARARRGPERRASGHRAAVLALAVSAALCGNVARADSYPIIIPQGQSLIANQLQKGSNSVAEIFANVPNGCVLSKYNNGSGTWSNAYFSAGSWMPDTLTLSPGEGAWFQSPTNFTLTVTGTPHVPVLPVSISPGHLYLLSCQTNDIGTWDNIVGTGPADGTIAYTYNGGFTAYAYSDLDGFWSPITPSVPVGSALWIRTPGGADNLYPPPFITQQPMSVTPTQGQTTTFTVTAVGTPPLSYQWRFNLTNILSGATNTTYTVVNAQASDAGAYDVVVSNPGGSVTSQVATLQLWQSYTINLPGGGHEFYLIANQLDHGSNTLDEVLPNMPNGTTIQMWNCSLQAFGPVAATFSARAHHWSANLTLAPGQGALLYLNGSLSSITFTGTPHVPVLPAALPCGYGAATVLSRQTNDVGTFENITGLSPTEGAQVLLWNAPVVDFDVCTYSGGTWYPSVPAVGVGGAALITVPGGTNSPCLALQCPSNILVQACSSTAVNYSATAADLCNNNPSPSITFYPPSGTVFPVGTNPVLCVGYSLLGHAASCVFSVTVQCTNLPVITQQPMSVSATQGQTTTFTVTAVGAPPLSYQWRFNLTNILSGATNATYTVFSAQAYDAGAYDVVVSNPGGSVTSSNAVLTVLPGSAPCVVTLNCPGNIVLPACTNAIVNYSVTGTNTCGGQVTVTCIPPSGSLFGPGTTAVQCLATNASGYATNCVFTVTLECLDTGCCSNSVWTTIPLTNHPSARQVPAMAYDSARGVGVLFGGYDATGQPLGDTWLWDGAQWQQALPTTSPSPRYGHEIAYDEARQVVVLYGGVGSSGTVLGDTWEWDGVNWTLRSAVASPGPRLYHAMAYDYGQNRVLLFGGAGASGALSGDSWEWTGATWVLVAANGAGPAARFWTAMAADPVRQRVVLFGGSTNGLGNFDDTWEWNGAAWNHVAAAGPPARQGHALAFSSPCASVLLFGGSNPQLGVLGDTWSWDGNGWASRASSGPSPRQYLKLATDSQNAAVTLFGGANGASTSDATWKWGCNCQNTEVSLDASGNPILPPGIDPSSLEYVVVNRPLGTTDQLYPEWDTSTDMWYTNLNCQQSVGGIVPTNASNPDLIGALAGIGITNVLPEEISSTVSNWQYQINVVVSNETINLSTAPPIGPNYYPPGRPHCTDPTLAYAFGGRDIIFVHGLQIKHLLDKVGGNIPGAQATWQTTTQFPADGLNSDFYGTGYFKDIANKIWEGPNNPDGGVGQLSHIYKFLFSPPHNYRNRYLIVSYPCTERLEIAVQAVLTQISDAMHFGTGVVDLSGNNDITDFGTPSFVVVSHSTGGLVTDVAMTAAAEHLNLNAAYIPRLCKAHVAMEGAFSGSDMAVPGVALSGIIGPQTASWACQLITSIFNDLENVNSSPNNCMQIVPTISSSILVDLCPRVTQSKWVHYVASMPVRTITMVGGHPTYQTPIKNLLHPGFDDGVLTISSQVANPNKRENWPSGFTPSDGYLSLIHTFDMGVAGEPWPFNQVTLGLSSVDALNSPRRAAAYYVDQMFDIQRPQHPPAFIAGAATPFISPTGMRQNVGGESPDTSTLNRYPNHYSFLQAATDHLSGFNNKTFQWSGADYLKTKDVVGPSEMNREESRVITDLHVFESYPMWYPGDDAPLLCADHLPKVQTWERGRYLKPIQSHIWGRTITWFPGGWIWHRYYDLLDGWDGKMGCDYMYESVLQCSPLKPCPTCIPPPADLALWLPMDETSGSTVHNLAGSFNGTLYSGSTVAAGGNGPSHIIPPNPNYHTTPIDGYNGSGLCFNGIDDSVVVPSYSEINVGGGDFTIDAWVKLDPNFGNSARTIVDKVALSQDKGYSLAVRQGHLILLMYDSGNDSQNIDTGTVPNDGLWHFVAVTVKRSDIHGLRFYIDGTPTGVFDPTLTFGSLDNTLPLSIGTTHTFLGSSSGLWLGCIDEVEVFRRALGLPEIQLLYGAKWEGKCKFACHVTPVLTLCLYSNSVTTAAQICNYSVAPQTFNYFFQSCTPNVPMVFSPAAGSVLVQPGQCAMVPVTIMRPNALADCCPSFCYQMTMQPIGWSETFQSTGTVSEVSEICSRSPSSQPATAAGTNRPILLSGFQLANNSGTNQTLHYRWIVLDILGLADTSHVSLNGLPPGTPVTNSVTLVAGGATNLAVSARFVLPDPLGFYNVVLQMDVNGAWLSLASYSLQYEDVPSEQPPLAIVLSGNNIVISWNASGACHVQSATQVQGAATAWTDVPGLSPVTIPITGANQFFRLVCP
jgi:hypothetical protein